MVIEYKRGTDKYKNWIIEETAFKKENQAKFETIFSLGNGYMGLRASAEETYPNERRGFYIAGIFDEFPGEVTEMPNLPDWIRTEIHINGELFKLDKGKIFEYSRKLNLKDGLLTRDFHWESPRGEMIEFSFERFISLNNLHTGVSKIEIKPLNFSGQIKLISGFDARVSNSGTQHLKEGEKRLIEDYIVYQPETQQSAIKLSFGLHHDFYKNQEKIEPQKDFKAERRRIKKVYEFNLKQKEKATIIKRLSAFTNKDKDVRKDENLEDKMIDNLIDIRDTAYKKLKDDHIQKWRSVWEESDLKISGSDFDQLALRFAIFHLIQMTPAHDDRISIAAKGLSGEGYKGHVFWDTEVFILPFFIYTYPEIARNLLKYRYHTLDGAR
ncbi:MAG: glycoside hydrolase family 65 protein, partial [Halanaerobiales bacterium]|nr:glycoside hydrolase family 65 protein [Halanaerobiales bacterium]